MKKKKDGGGEEKKFNSRQGGLRGGVRKEQNMLKLFR